MAVDSYLTRIFGESKLNQLKSTKVLMVGAGGIGCELLKDLIMMHYGEIHVLDLDTIDLSNLNRQFLFRQKDIKKFKSETAIRAVESFNHQTKLVSYTGNIMDSNLFPISFFKQFDLIFNALDNLEARFYVNKISLFTKIPLMESGTTGLQGQVQPILPYLSECFDCIPKETPKTFPVCTIRSTPSKPIHCITWSKNFLMPQLFGEDDDTESNLKDPTNEDSDNKEEVELLNKETSEFFELKQLIKSSRDSDDNSFVFKIIDKIFKEDIENLLLIDSLWETRQHPTPLNYKQILSEKSSPSITSPTTKKTDQMVLSPRENIELLIKTIISLSKRSTPSIEFDKDDDETLDFVLATSNLRSFIFGIELKSKFEVKQIAGNIIPAVATTNAIIAGFSAISSIHIVNGSTKDLKMTFDSGILSNKFISSTGLSEPIENCRSCSITRGICSINNNKNKANDVLLLKAFKNSIVDKYGYSDDIVIIKSTDNDKLIYDYDFDDNLDAPLAKFFQTGDVLYIGDSDEILDGVELYINFVDDIDEGLVLPDLDIPAYKQKKIDEGENDVAADGDLVEADQDGVINLDDDDDDDNGSKKRKIDELGSTTDRKKQRIEQPEDYDDDLVILD